MAAMEEVAVEIYTDAVRGGETRENKSIVVERNIRLFKS